MHVCNGLERWVEGSGSVVMAETRMKIYVPTVDRHFKFVFPSDPDSATLPYQMLEYTEEVNISMLFVQTFTDKLGRSRINPNRTYAGLREDLPLRCLYPDFGSVPLYGRSWTRWVRLPWSLGLWRASCEDER